jgi:hypothetical protein
MGLMGYQHISVSEYEFDYASLYLLFTRFKSKQVISSSYRGVAGLKELKPVELGIIFANLDRQISANPQLGSDFFEDRMLVPIPRSVPYLKGSKWTSLELSKKLCANGLGAGFDTLISRDKKVLASSRCAAKDRPDVHAHMGSMSVKNQILANHKICLIDDVYTMGSTSMACYILLKDKYPNADIKLFTFFRTMGIENDFEKIETLVKGKSQMTYPIDTRPKTSPTVLF